MLEKCNNSLLSEEDADKHGGQYVCLANFNSKEIIAANYDLSLAYAEAQKRDYDNPVIFYVPRKSEIFIFHQEAN